MIKPIRLFTPVWGDLHLDWFKRACVASLNWPKNRQVLQHELTRWTIYSKRENANAALELAVTVLPKEQIEFLELPASVQGSSPEMGSVILNGFLQVMRKCIEDNYQLLMAPPDTMFGDGTIPNLIEMTRGGPDLCVAVAHPRVSPSIFSQIKGPMSNAKLVTAAWKHLHKAMSQAECGLPQSNTFVGGISWRKLTSDETMVSVQHMLPTVYLANFTPHDLTFFQQPHDGLPPTFGVYDHGWPSGCLIKEQRQRLVGSSDACFIVELTEEAKNIPPVLTVNPFQVDAFWRDQLHNRHNRQHLVIFRGE